MMRRISESIFCAVASEMFCVARHRMAQEDLFLILGIGDGAEIVAHAEAGDHGARHAGRLFDVARRAGGNLVVTEHKLFGDAPAEGDAQIGQHLLARYRKLIALGQTHDHAQRPAARNDRSLVDRIGAIDANRHERMAALVIGGELLLFLAHGHRAALRAHQHLVLGVLEFGHGDDALAAASGQAAPPR